MKQDDGEKGLRIVHIYHQLDLGCVCAKLCMSRIPHVLTWGSASFNVIYEMEFTKCLCNKTEAWVYKNMMRFS